MNTINKGQRIRDFFNFEADAMDNRSRIIEALLPASSHKGSSHAGEEGRYLEAILRDFLNRHLPKELKAMTGFILLPATKTGEYNTLRAASINDQHSKQLDIIVYDIANYPIYEMYEEFCIVPPEGVVGIVSVKKNLSATDVKKEIDSLYYAINLCKTAFCNKAIRPPYTGIFAFATPMSGCASTPEKLFDCIKRKLINRDYDDLITEISVLKRYTIFKFRKNDSCRQGEARYVNVKFGEEGHTSIQRMLNSILSVYYDSTRKNNHERPGFVCFEKGVFNDADTLGFVPYI